jgi:hypothetical protein
MALRPVSVPALNREPPARPATPQERLAVPGAPRAESQRSAQAPGRIPVGADSAAQEPLRLIEDIDRQVKNSVEYQALRPYLEKAGLIDEEEAAAAKTTEAPEAATEAATVVQAERISLRISFTRISVELRSTRSEAPPQRADPLALDLDGDGLETSGIGNGVRFDIDADGQVDHTSFVSGGDAFVALDTNGNGRIDSGAELFGDQLGDANGYLALARYDDNGDRRIDRADSVFQRLRLFSLAADGSQRLQGLEEAGVASIGLDYRDSSVALNAYDRIAQQASFVRDDGSEGQSGDLLLAYRRA